MSEIQSKIVECEVFVTSDGEEFSDDLDAQDHQDFLNARERFLKMVKMTEREFETLWVSCSDYTEKLVRF